jgi:DNA (cytosine-5)-methyltransferase 1
MKERVRTVEFEAIDLCSGPGGVTTGYKAAGIKVLAAVDIDSNSRATYASNHPEVRLLSDDLADLEPAHLLKIAGINPGELGVLTACVPCQTFSSLGRKNRKKDDPRNRLVERIGNFVEDITPRAVVMENVPPLRDDYRFKRLVRRLRCMGYGVWHDVVDAAKFGVPQRRRRLVLIALKGFPDEAVPALDHEDPLLRNHCEERTVRDAFRLLRRRRDGDVLSSPRLNYPKIVADRIAAIPLNGGSRTSLPAELELSCHGELGKKDRKTAAGNVYGRMALDEVAPTLTTRCTTPACGRFLHPWENRAITLREAAVLQTFPVNYRFEGGVMSIQAQIGNAVPPKLAEAIAIIVRDALERSAQDQDGTQGAYSTGASGFVS